MSDIMNLLQGYIIRILTAIIATGLGVVITTLGLSSTSINVAEVSAGAAAFVLGVAMHIMNHTKAIQAPPPAPIPQQGKQL